MYSWRDRETVMDLLEDITGNRVNYSINVLGGVKNDISAEQAEAIRQGMEYLETRVRHYLEIVTTDVAFLQRTRGVGVMTAEEVERLGVSHGARHHRDIRVKPLARTPTPDQACGDGDQSQVYRVPERNAGKLQDHPTDNLPPGE
jgi:NADH-quinone oxidoreductase subunit D